MRKKVIVSQVNAWGVMKQCTCLFRNYKINGKYVAATIYSSCRINFVFFIGPSKETVI